MYGIFCFINFKWKYSFIFSCGHITRIVFCFISSIQINQIKNNIRFRLGRYFCSFSQYAAGTQAALSRVMQFKTKQFNVLTYKLYHFFERDAGFCKN